MWNNIWQQLVRFGFHLLYYELAWAYDVVSWFVSLGQWRAWQLSALPFLVGPRVLELGHGPGHILLVLARADYQAVGIDLSPTMGRMAGRRLKKAGYRPKLVRGDVHYLPFTNEFNSVLATFPTDYIVHPGTLAAVHRLLRPGGRLVIVPAAELTNSGLIARFIEWLYTITGQTVPRKEFGRPVPSTQRLLEAALDQAGFSSTFQTVTFPGSMVTVVVAEKV
jgi:ubiquinone/menaquinone biosynthesis C-methylase UbiE